MFMEQVRYNMLMKGIGTLTEAEVKHGWHFCPEWDFLLISPNSKEAECCSCKRN